MSHAEKADKLLIKPAAGARPAPPACGQITPKAHTKRPVTRRVTRDTATPRQAGWHSARQNHRASLTGPPSVWWTCRSAPSTWSGSEIQSDVQHATGLLRPIEDAAEHASA